MHAIIGITRLLLQGKPQPELAENLTILRSSGENLLRLINNILDFSKIEVGKVELEATPFSLQDLTDSLLHSFTYQANEKRINFNVNYDKNISPNLIGDPVRLNQILNNLISNAIKFTREGSVKLEIRLLEESEEEATIGFKVNDTGIGIPKDKIPLIFEGFTQASADTTRRFGGTGLGLAIVKNLIELHSSQLKVKSILDKGSEFSFSVRYVKSKIDVAPPETMNAADDKNKDLKGIRILLAEDNEINQLVAGKIIQPWNVQLEYAENGQVAVEKVQHQNYDVVLMDLQMPVMDGYKATRTIRSMEKYAKNPVIIIALTASAMLETRQKVDEAGFDDYVSKPFNPDELYLKIKSYIEKTENGRPFISSGEKHQPAVSSHPSIGFEKIYQLFNNDKQQIENFLQKCIDQVSTLKANYGSFILNQEAAALGSAVHKVKSFLTFLEASFLVDEIEKGKELLAREEKNEKVIRETIEMAEKDCDQFIRILQNEIQDLTSGIAKE